MLSLVNGFSLYGQESKGSDSKAAHAGRNYTFFSARQQNNSDEVYQFNQGYEQHPELGQTFAEAPCSDCFEMIGKRTQSSKTYIRQGSNGREIMQQTGSAPMHYRDSKGNWLTVNTRLKPMATSGAGTYSASAQETPVMIDLSRQATTLGTEGDQFGFNHNLELIFEQPGGVQQSLGRADYSRFTAGDDGVFITDAWPGIDIEMYVLRGALKTNFIVRKAMPDYAAGNLRVRDHTFLPEGWSLRFEKNITGTHPGSLEIIDQGNTSRYFVSEATVYEEQQQENTTQKLAYSLLGGDLDIVLPGHYLTLPPAAYPVVIDPLVYSTSSFAVAAGSSFSPAWTSGCPTSNLATVPAGVTVTDVQFSFTYTATGGAGIGNGAYYFRSGSCRSPFAGSWWTCPGTGPGSCVKTNTTIFPEISSCIPGPQCIAYNLNLTMFLSQNYGSTTTSCSNAYITAAGTNLYVTVFGHTVENSSVTSGSTGICQGATAVLNAAASYGVGPISYSWTPGSFTGPTVTVNPATSTVYTLTATDACGHTSDTTFSVTVNPIGPVGGSSVLCPGGTTTLTDAGGTGSWTSSNSVIAAVGSSSGIVTAGSTGTANIYYTSLAGCTANPFPVTIKPQVSAVSGAGAVCQGSTVTFSDATSGGTWSSASPGVATVSGSGTIGVATGVAAGTAVISYNTTGAGCFATRLLTVNALSSIAGISTICLGGTTTLTDAATGGTWTGSNPSIASVGPSSGVVHSLSLGLDTITYTLPTGCNTTRTLNVYPLTAISGSMALCQGSSETLTHGTPGGTWSSSNPLIATIDPGNGTVSAIAGGTTTISYTLPGGCMAVAALTVNALPVISGAPSVCVGGTTPLVSSTGPSSWSSSNPSLASVDMLSGIVTGTGVGVCNITCTSASGCSNHMGMIVSLATPITGITSVCPGGSVTLADVTTGGTWSSANTGIATVGSLSGTVTGISGGIVDIHYTNPAGCTVGISFAVNDISPITGSTHICAGNSAQLLNAITGGAWSSSDPSVAAVDMTSGNITGHAAGSCTITYTAPTGCIATTIVSVDSPMPNTGSGSVCMGNTTTLSNPVTSGTWSSANAGVAVIGTTTGVVTTVTPGVAAISYTTATGCISVSVVTVNAVAPVTGVSAICSGSSTPLSNTISGGSWSSTNIATATVGIASGIVTGVAAGAATINYTTAAGCMSGIVVTVNATPSPIAGSTLLCTYSTLTDAMPGGTWSSSNTSVAVIGATSGMATGLAPGTVDIVYALTNGCSATLGVTVDPLLPVSGTPAVCMGGSAAFSYPSGGGTWSSFNPGIAAVGAGTGIVTGISGGATIISYQTTSGCIATKSITVNPVTPIAGSPIVCQSATTALTDGVPGGSWSTSDPGIAPVDAATGLVTGLAAGTATINYTTAAGCVAITSLTVNPLEMTTGAPAVCVGNTTLLSNHTSGGGTWTSVSPSTATVGSATGWVTGTSAGIALIKFTTSEGCVAWFTETINALPGSIVGALSVCSGSTSSLSDTYPGGTWSSSDISVATVGSASGVLQGISANTATISYTTAAGCSVAAMATVNPLPLPVTGMAVICQGATTTFFDATPGGTWSSVGPSVATVGPASGIVNGLAAGTTFIKYVTPAGCFMARQLTVNALPSAITGTTVLCEGATSALGNALPGGTWNSTDPASATVGALSGLLSGVSAGYTTITYITAAGCFATTGVTVNHTPAISSYTFSHPTTCVNSDGSVTLNGLSAGQAYTVHYMSGTTPVAVPLTADGTGRISITGLAAGAYSAFSVTTAAGCSSNVIAGPLVLVLPPTPATPVAANNTPECAGTTIKLTATDATAGVTYNWAGPGGFTSSMQNPVIAPSVVSASGVYTVTVSKLACVSAAATTTVVVHPVPAITQVASGNPTTCYGTDGVIELEGLAPGVAYSIAYLYNGTGASANETADATGKIVLTGLKAGDYTSIYASSFTCVSNQAGPVTLTDPPAPPAPTLWSNSPICAGKKLTLTAYDAATGLTYDWQGPNGYSSAVQNPEIDQVTMADSGIFTLTIRRLNCPTTVTESILVYPPVVLKDVTPSQVVPLGGSITLHVSGAEFYMWAPHDGTLSNPNIDSPVAAPQVTTTYSVVGTNTWGCLDTAAVTLTIDDNIDEYLPNAFTPNNDGKNDVFRIVNVKYDKLVDFTIYNRWGQLVYHNSYEPEQGWDGTYRGVPQDMGTYYYNIILTRPDGKTRTIKGEVILMR